MGKGKSFFGFREVSSAVKQGLVNNVFNDVSSRYDLMNDFMSFGLHRLWKKRLINMVPVQSKNILDVASGTGDIAINISEDQRFTNCNTILCDINSAMLNTGRNRIIDRNMINRVSFVVGDAEKLPCKDNSFDCYIVAFGIRNVTNIQKALKEAYRVLKPGGKFLCLELSMIDEKTFAKLYDFYSFNVIPFVGQFITKKREAYQYLVESIRTFPTKSQFKSMISNSGFGDVGFESLTFGVVAIHSGYKREGE